MACERLEVSDTLGIGWCVRILGNDIHEPKNQYGCKPLRTLQIASHLESKEKAEKAAEDWLNDQLSKLSTTRSAG
ncbi:hypothetical protein [Vreelandella titanicae]|uniref:hypothetical protein n=1 Tax=Vreelandella titanicae TaxID=664683 RepID=UPI0038145BA5